MIKLEDLDKMMKKMNSITFDGQPFSAEEDEVVKKCYKHVYQMKLFFNRPEEFIGQQNKLKDFLDSKLDVFYMSGNEKFKKLYESLYEELFEEEIKKKKITDPLEKIEALADRAVNNIVIALHDDAETKNTMDMSITDIADNFTEIKKLKDPNAITAKITVILNKLKVFYNDDKAGNLEIVNELLKVLKKIEIAKNTMKQPPNTNENDVQKDIENNNHPKM